MRTIVTRLFFALPLACLLSCRSQQQISQSSARLGAFTYTAKMVNGHVFLSLNTNLDRMIGPFVAWADGRYTCETQGEGVHSLMRSPAGDWFYSWSWAQMRAQPVDATALER